MVAVAAVLLSLISPEIHSLLPVVVAELLIWVILVMVVAQRRLRLVVATGNPLAATVAIQTTAVAEGLAQVAAVCTRTVPVISLCNGGMMAGGMGGTSQYPGYGGFGGGGGSFHGGGGGGGYTGGSGGTYYVGGGGAGSYNVGLNPASSPNFNGGDGYIVISQ